MTSVAEMRVIIAAFNYALGTNPDDNELDRELRASLDALAREGQEKRDG